MLDWPPDSATFLQGWAWHAEWESRTSPRRPESRSPPSRWHSTTWRAPGSARRRGERIRAVAKSLGYVPNRLAQGLRRQRSGIVGFVGDRVATTPYAVRMILGAQETFLEADQLMVLMDSGGDPDLEVRQITTLREHQVNGIVYAAMYHRQLDRLPDALGSVPTCCWTPRSTTPRSRGWCPTRSPAPGKPWQSCSPTVTGGSASSPMRTTSRRRRLRLRGYKAALKRAGVAFDTTLVSAGPPNADGGYRAALPSARPARPAHRPVLLQRPHGHGCLPGRRRRWACAFPAICPSSATTTCTPS